MKRHLALIPVLFVLLLGSLFSFIEFLSGCIASACRSAQTAIINWAES